MSSTITWNSIGEKPMTVADLPQTLFLLRRNPPKNPDGSRSEPKIQSLVFGATTHSELVLFLWSTLPAAISWRLEEKLDAQIIETDRDTLIPAIQEKIPGCFLFFNAKPGETTFNFRSDRMIQLPVL